MATKKNANPATEEATVDPFADYGETGFETTSDEDYSKPWLLVLQANSPQVLMGHAKHVPGATAGMVMNAMDLELMSALDVVVGAYFKHHTEWVPRDNGGGFVGVVDSNDEIVQEYEARRLVAQQARMRGERGEGADPRKVLTKNGTQLVATAYFGVLYRAVEDGQPSGDAKLGLISCKSTQLKFARDWLPQLRQAPAGRGSYLWNRWWRLTTTLQTNDDGSWFGWQAKPGPLFGTTEEELAIWSGTLRPFREQSLSSDQRIAIGQASAETARIEDQSGGGSSGSSSSGGAPAPQGDEIPF